LNGFSIGRKNSIESKTNYYNSLGEHLILENVGHDILKNQGGIIIFRSAIEVNSNGDNQVLNFIKSELIKIGNKISPKKDHIQSEIYGLTIGNFVKGRYTDNQGRIWDEQCASVEILGVSNKVLDAVANDLVRELKLESVLVKNYTNKDMYLIF